jgi:hypothetical protein
VSEPLKWIKSTYSSTGNCVEVGKAAGRMLVRDTKQVAAGPVLAFSADAWSRFAAALKDGKAQTCDLPHLGRVDVHDGPVGHGHHY